jgi:alanine racemase
MTQDRLASSGARLSIDLDALCDNWRSLKARLHSGECAARTTSRSSRIATEVVGYADG